jgi:hypothetical protein
VGLVEKGLITPMLRPRRHPVMTCPSVKVTLLLAKEDWVFLQRRHPFGASAVLRDLIAQYRSRCEHRDQDEVPFDRESLRDL